MCDPNTPQIEMFMDFFIRRYRTFMAVEFYTYINKTFEQRKHLENIHGNIIYVVKIAVENKETNQLIQTYFKEVTKTKLFKQVGTMATRL